MKEEVIERQPITEIKLTVENRKSDTNNDFVNLYVYLDGYRFELVPHCRTKKETAFFYALLSRSSLMLK